MELILSPVTKVPAVAIPTWGSVPLATFLKAGNLLGESALASSIRKNWPLRDVRSSSSSCYHGVMPPNELYLPDLGDISVKGSPSFSLSDLRRQLCSRVPLDSGSS